MSEETRIGIMACSITVAVAIAVSGVVWSIQACDIWAQWEKAKISVMMKGGKP